MKIALAGNPNSGKTTLFNAITGKTEYVGNWPGVTVEKKEADLKRAFMKAANKAMTGLSTEAGNDWANGSDGTQRSGRTHDNDDARGNGKVRGNDVARGNGDMRGNGKVHGNDVARGNDGMRGNGKVHGNDVARGNGDMRGNGKVHGNDVARGNGDMRGNGKVHGNDVARGNDGMRGRGKVRGNGDMRGAGRIRVVDLPGAYSISPYTSEEAITRDFITGENPDVIINIIDCSSLERSLFFTTQLLELGIPMVIALNKLDIIRRHGDKIDVDGLSGALGCRIVEVTANEGEGLNKLIAEAVKASVQDRGKLRNAGFTADHAGSGSVPSGVVRMNESAGAAGEEKSAGSGESAGEARAAKSAGEAIPAGLCKSTEKAATSGPDRSAEEDIPSGSGRSAATIGAVKPTGPDEMDRARQAYVKKITGRYFTRKRSSNELTTSDKIDRVAAHPFFGLVIFALIMWGVYALSINGIGGWASGYINDVLFAETIPNALNSFFKSIELSPILQTLIVDGAVGGVGAVLGFIPLVMVLFFCLALLEDSGYMARVAVVMDRYFKKIGLSGRSIIPMIVGTGCSIPGVMATRAIEDDTERRITAMLTPFMPCGAKLPVIALFAAVFFPGATWVFPAIYVLAVLVIIAGGLLLKKIFRYKGEHISAFILELPEYKLPSMRHALRQMLKQALAFVRKAATIILVMNTLVWVMQMYGWNFQPAEDQSLSILATIGSIVAPLLIPLGLGSWQMASSILTGFIAKENVVASLAILLASSEEALYAANGPLAEMFTPVTAFAFLAFNLFAPPCFAAVGAMNSELGGRKRILWALLFQLGVGYTVAMLINQAGTLLVYGRPANGVAASVIIAAALVCIVITIIRSRNSKTRGLGNAIREGNAL